MCDDEYARVAHDLVDIAINHALALLAESDWCDVSLDEYVVPADVKRRTSVDRVTSDKQVEPQPNVSWPTIEEFTPDLGTERILEFIKVVASQTESSFTDETYFLTSHFTFIHIHSYQAMK